MNWIDVRERLPEHGQKVIIKVRDGTVTAAQADRNPYTDVKVDWDPVGVDGYDVEWAWCTDYKDPYRSVTHWMPLPDA